jgi:hypothetical protein
MTFLFPKEKLVTCARYLEIAIEKRAFLFVSIGLHQSKKETELFEVNYLYIVIVQSLGGSVFKIMISEP